MKTKLLTSLLGALLGSILFGSQAIAQICPIPTSNPVQVCENTLGLIELSLTNPHPTGVTYEWSGPGLIQETGTTVFVDPNFIATGTNEYIITSFNLGCSEMGSTIIEVFTNDIEATGNPTTICPSVGTTYLSVSGNSSFSYSWSGENLIDSTGVSVQVDVSEMSPGDHVYQITYSDGICIGQTTSTLTIQNEYDLLLEDVSVCEDEDYIVLTIPSPEAGYQYDWQGPELLNNAGDNVYVHAANLEPGQYEYIVQASTGANCGDTDTLILTILENAPELSGPSVGICTDGTATLEVFPFVDGLEYNWIGPNIIQKEDNFAVIETSFMEDGTYTYTVTAGNPECGISQTTIDLTVGDSPSIITFTSSACEGDPTASLNAATSPGTTLSWNGPGIISGTTGSSITVNTSSFSPGTYTYTITANNGVCSVSETTFLIIEAAPQINSIQVTDVCEGDDTASISVSGSTDITYNWSGAGIDPGTSGSQVTINTSELSSGIYIYTVTADNGTCSNTESISLTITPTPQILTSNVTICEDETSAFLFASEDTGSNLIWNGPGIATNTTGNNITVNTSSLAPGTYGYSITAVNDGCSSTEIAYLTIEEPLAIIPNDQDICQGDSFTTLSVSGDPSNFYSWIGPGLLNTSGPSVYLDAGSLAPGEYTYTITGNDGTCEAEDFLTVSINPTPELSVLNTDPITCLEDGTLLLEGSSSLTDPGYNYTWEGPGITPGISGIVATADISTLSTGNYSYTLTSTDGICITSETFNFYFSECTPRAEIVIEDDVPNDTGGGFIVPLGLSYTNGVPDPIGHYWSGNPYVEGNTEASFDALFPSTGEYPVCLTVTNLAHGYSSTSCDTIEITVPPCLPVTQDTVVVPEPETAHITWEDDTTAIKWRVQTRYRIGSTLTPWETVHVTNNEITLTGLTPGLIHHYRIRKQCQYGWSSFTPIKVWLQTDCPTVDANSIEFFNPGTNGNTHYFLTWDGVPGADKYSISYREQGTSSWTTITSPNPWRSIDTTLLTLFKYYEFRIKARCSSGLWSPWSETVVFFTTTLVIINRTSDTYQVHMFPNPCVTSVNVSFTSDTQGTIEYEIINLLGRTVMKIPKESQIGTNRHTFRVGELNDGNYILSGRTNGKIVITERFVKASY